MPVRVFIQGLLMLFGASVCYCQESVPASLQSESSHLIDPQKLEFFERKVRPLLVEHCLECHSSNTEASGGLVLDSRQGIERGGDSGPVIQKDSLKESRFIEAIEYRNLHLQMPPDGRLPQASIDVLRTWIEDGAIDPREEDVHTVPSSKTTHQGLSVERASEHWAYRPLKSVVPPKAANQGEDRKSAELSSNPIDALLSVPMREMRLSESEIIDFSQFRKRLHLDLLGVMPVGEFGSVSAEVSSAPDTVSSEELRNALVDELVASPLFGERMARHWMDVMRFSESITLRGFVLPEAWQYRNYLIDAFNQDRRFDLVIEEHIAGDLIEEGTLNDRQRGLVATMALQLGDTNLEEQDKLQLEMDYVDEQLDTIGKAFLGQTLGCARCHDHKFDPIPTRDYYALAGILKASVPIDHSNVSSLVRKSLPLEAEREQQFESLARELKDAQSALAAQKKKKPADGRLPRIVKRSELPGVVVDDTDAKKIGAWQESSFVAAYVGDGYVHDKNELPGEKSVTFEPTGLPPGEYVVRMSYSSGENRCSKTEVRVFSADGETLTVLNQKVAPADDGVWQTLGKFRFEAGGQSFVLVSNVGADGYVMADAIQFVREDDLRNHEAAGAVALVAGSSSVDEKKVIADLEAKVKSLETAMSQRPKVVSFRDASSNKMVDIPVHVRGSVHTLGAVVPRGFLQCVPSHDDSLRVHEGTSGRRELGRWLTGPARHLTARVYVNRVWSWLMVEGLVSTVDNFGTTGEAPLNAELLDWLAEQFIQHDWSTKWLVKTIVTSNAYRRSIVAAGDSASIDPGNQCFARANLRRLDAESLRDTMLMASGELALVSKIGTTIRDNTSEDYRYANQSHLRTVYGPWFRNSPMELYQEFDGANLSVTVGQRNRSTVATQSLALMNSEWVRGRVEETAKRIAASESKDVTDQLRHCFKRIYGREPQTNEFEWFLRSMPSRTNKTPDEMLSAVELEQIVHMMFASLAFRFVE